MSARFTKVALAGASLWLLWIADVYSQDEGRTSVHARGRELASNGANGIAACATCHGAQGEGNAAGGFPRLAGQPAYYLERQMNAFADGSRTNPIMTPIAQAMTDEQRRDSSAWYASLGASAVSAKSSAADGTGRGATPKPDAAQRRRALALLTRGDHALQVQACNNCHGPNGAGEAPMYPYLAGQHASYLTAAMAEWKSGARKTDPSGQMTTIAARLGDRDVAALSAYFAAQAPQAPALRTNVAAGSSARPAVAAGPDAPGPRMSASAPQGVGTEQGAPLTGGNQGQGGGGGAQGNQSQQPQQPQSQQQRQQPPQQQPPQQQPPQQPPQQQPPQQQPKSQQPPQR